MRGNARERGKKESDRGAKENTHMHTSEGERERKKFNWPKGTFNVRVFCVCAKQKIHTEKWCKS